MSITYIALRQIEAIVFILQRAGKKGLRTIFLFSAWVVFFGVISGTTL